MGLREPVNDVDGRVIRMLLYRAGVLEEVDAPVDAVSKAVASLINALAEAKGRAIGPDPDGADNAARAFLLGVVEDKDADVMVRITAASAMLHRGRP